MAALGTSSNFEEQCNGVDAFLRPQDLGNQAHLASWTTHGHQQSDYDRRGHNKDSNVRQSLRCRLIGPNLTNGPPTE
jgi:hypothetical protein